MSQLEEIIGDYLQACEKGEAPDRIQLCAQHPDIAADLDEFFTQHDLMQGASSSLKQSGIGQEPSKVEPTEDPPFVNVRLAEHTTKGVPNQAAQRIARGQVDQIDPTLFSGGPSQNSPSTMDQPQLEFGPYEIKGEIARGGMGVVYRAKHKEIGRTVALKMIQAGRLASQSEIDRFLTEAGAVACLSHSGIVPLYEFGEQNGWHYYTMELIEGTDLSGRIPEDGMSAVEAAQTVLAMARAVAHAHEKGIVHRDLKPSNVLIDKDGNPRITDFGLAKRLNENEHLTMTGQIVGTASYMAPEQAAGSAEIDERADIYSLGSILYCLSTGQPPFQADNQLDLLLRVLEGEPRSPRLLRSDLPRPLEQICMKCLRRSKDERYATASEVADDLERFLGGEPVEAAPPALWTRLQRWSRQKPALAAHVGGLLVIEVFRQFRYLTSSLESMNELRYHLTFSLLFLIWGTLSFALQFMSDRTRYANLARYLWIGLDVIMATTGLSIVQGDLGMLAMCLALIIVGSGAFSRVRIVVWATIAVLSAFLFLLMVRPELQAPDQYAPISFSFLAVFGILVGVQVHRLRLLSKRLGL